MSHPVLAKGSGTPQPPGRTPHKAPQTPLRCPGGETLLSGGNPRTPVPPEASEAPAREAMNHTYGPTSAGTVLLDLGADTGALVLYTPADLGGAEIEISPSTPGAVRTHAAVRPRPGPRGMRYAAVYDGLAAGGYTIWRDHDTPAGTVTIHGGQVASHHW